MKWLLIILLIAGYTTGCAKKAIPQHYPDIRQFDSTQLSSINEYRIQKLEENTESENKKNKTMRIVLSSATLVNLIISILLKIHK